MKILTSTKEFNVAIVGISSLDNSLHIEITDAELNDVFSVFSNPSETGKIERVWDDGGKDEFHGYTNFKFINQLYDGHIVVALSRG